VSYKVTRTKLLCLGDYGYFGYTQKNGGQGAEFGYANGKGKEGVMHVAFNADSKDTVKKYHDVALAAGGKDNGGPGPRTQYGPTYYAAFVLDPDGNNIEFCYIGNE
jgi:catechol 2,3-dioxygenase-like lactoylglutathione lyase family enzyme